MAAKDPYDPPGHALCVEMNPHSVSTPGRPFDEDSNGLPGVETECGFISTHNAWPGGSRWEDPGG